MTGMKAWDRTSPFRDLAWGLALQGVAVLRYEKRTRQYAEKMAVIIDQITVKEETIEDALLAVDLLRNTDGIDPQHIYVLGHSLGGMLFPGLGCWTPASPAFSRWPAQPGRWKMS